MKDQMAEDKIRASMNIDIHEGINKSEYDDDEQANDINITMQNTTPDTIESTNVMVDDDPHPHPHSNYLFSPKPQQQQHMQIDHHTMPQISPMQHLGSPNYKSPNNELNIATIKSKSKSKSRSRSQQRKRKQSIDKTVTETEMTNFIKDSVEVNVHESVSGITSSEEYNDDDGRQYRKTKKLF